MGLSDTPDEEFYRIGMVFQDPDSQIVMDSVWHELAFSLESQGLDRLTMRKRIAEMARFFGLEPILEKSVHDLSGGEKQLVNLASVLLLRPEVLLLDEPVSQLDPVASEEFLHMVKRLNDEFSITIIIAEHNLQSLFSLADTIVLLESGSVKYQGCPQEVCRMLFQDINYRTFVPSSAQLYFSLQGEGQIPFTVKEAKTFMKGRQYRPERRKLCLDGPEILACSNITFRYEKDGQNVLENLSLSVHEGEILPWPEATAPARPLCLKSCSVCSVPSAVRSKSMAKNAANRLKALVIWRRTRFCILPAIPYMKISMAMPKKSALPIIHL